MKYNPNNQTVQPPQLTSRPVGDTVAQIAGNHIAGVNKVFGDYIAEPVGDEQTHKARIAAFQSSQAFKDIDAHVAAVDRNVEELEAQRANVLRGLSPDGSVDQELRNTRVWDRHRRVWDQQEGGKLASRVQQDIVAAPEPERGVLLAEAGSYLESRGVPAGFVEKAVEQVSPELAAAEAAVKAAKVEQMKVRYSATTVKNAVAAGRPAVTVIDP